MISIFFEEVLDTFCSTYEPVFFEPLCACQLSRRFHFILVYSRSSRWLGKLTWKLSCVSSSKTLGMSKGPPHTGQYWQGRPILCDYVRTQEIPKFRCDGEGLRCGCGAVVVFNFCLAFAGWQCFYNCPLSWIHAPYMWSRVEYVRIPYQSDQHKGVSIMFCNEWP